jgi:cellobiose-specific phosphotransferase system component IIA
MTSPRKSYSFKEGLAMLAAKSVGIDPDLAAEAGDSAKAALNALRSAKASKSSDRIKHIRAAQAELKSIDVKQHPKLVNAIQAQLLALQGRGGDTEIAHLTPGEVVLPRSLQTPALMKQIAALAA